MREKNLLLVVLLALLAVKLNANDLERVDCYPEAPYLFGQPVDTRCAARNCIFRSSGTAGAPWCFFPQDSYGYTMFNATKTGNKELIHLRRLTRYLSPFPDPIDHLILEAEYLNQKTFRLKIFDAVNKRYEVPLDLKDVHDANSFTSDFQFTYENRPSDSVFVFKVVRRSTGTVLFDTSLGAMVFCDQFLQIVTKMAPGSNLYGFGQNNHPRLSHEFNGKVWGMWARDEPNVAGEELNQYGVQPVYNVLESDGNAHGVVLVNSNAMEYELSPAPALIIRTIGGIFDFYFFSGPTPESVVQQYTALVGTPIMVPYWALGFQLSRWEYKDLADMKRIVQRNLDAGIPLDIQYADIEHMEEQMDFTISERFFKDLPNYVRELQSKGMHVVPIVDPALVINKLYKPYTDGLAQNVYIKWPAGMSPDFAETQTDNMLGYCWPNEKVVYPDFLNPRTESFWIDQLLDFRRVNFTYDAIWIDMNEPAVFDTNEEKPWNWPPDKFPYWTLKCPVNKYDDPPFRTKSAYRYDAWDKKARLSQKTLCLVGLQNDGAYRHYDVHNLYGLYESIITQKAVRLATNKRSFALSRSTFIGSGHYVGSWLGDNDSSYKDMYRSIIGMIESGIFGIPYIGADICGFTSETNEELCTRWQQVGAFYPYSRNHNVRGTKDQDPAAFSTQLIESTKTALNIRYTILPYFYTLFYRAHTQGKLVIKGLFQEFPTDDECRTIDKQFLVGPAFLVSPVLEPGQRSIDAYFSKQSVWYSYYDGQISRGWKKLDAPLNYINLHVRGGYIIPTQKPANNTSFSRKNPFGAIVALDDFRAAKGELFWDDGDSIDSISAANYYLSNFTFANDEFKMTIVKNNFAEMQQATFDTLRLFGYALPRSESDSQLRAQISQGGQLVGTYNIVPGKYGEVTLNNLNLKMTQEISIKFETVFYNETIDINDDRLRVDCHPEPGASQTSCFNRRCLWIPSSVSGLPWCFISKSRVSYVLQGQPTTTTGNQRNLKVYSAAKTDQLSFYGEDILRLKISVEQKGAKQLRLKIEDEQSARYEVPVKTSWSNAVTAQEGLLADNDFDARIESDGSGRLIIEVYRKSTGSRLFSTREYAESYVFSNRYIQLHARLATENVFGFGENTHETFRHRFDDSALTYSVWARDEPPAGGSRALYGTQPFYMSIEADGSAHGLLILNSNAQEYKFGAFKSFMYRTLGGILDIYMFSGPTPENVIQQYAGLVGKPFMPPYYALGFQLSKYGYNTIQNMSAAIDRTVNANIPFDIIHGDIDHFERNKDFTYDRSRFAGFPEYVNQLKTRGIRFIPIVDPALVTNEPDYMPYVRGMQRDVWIKWPDNNNPQASETVNRNMLGYVWPEGKVLFPDFFNNNTIDWWSNEIKLYYETFKFAGLWIDMNEPANFGTNQEKPFNWPQNLPPWSLKCPTSTWDDPPYRTNAAFGDRLSDKTLCLVGVNNDGVKTYRQYDVHNLFGYTQTIATHEALLRTIPNKRPVVITRSTYPGSGSMAGHWLGDNTSMWKHLKYNLVGLLEFNLFLIPYVGADICGFFGDADAELCERWMQLGAFNTFFRNHNGLYGTPQDPAAFGPVIAESMRKVVVIRYTLLPYLYTLFYQVHTTGGTVVRSLAHEFPRDKSTYDVDEQFLWGSGLLISPVIYQGKTSIEAYMPVQARWYSYYDGKEVNAGWVRLAAPRDFIPLHVRGGSILPTQTSAKNTDDSRRNPFGLIIAPDAELKASGQLYWDDGESYDSISTGQNNLYQFNYILSANRSTIDITTVRSGYPITNRMTSIRLFDVPSIPQLFLINGIPSAVKYTYDAITRALEMPDLNLNMGTNYKIEISY